MRRCRVGRPPPAARRRSAAPACAAVGRQRERPRAACGTSIPSVPPGARTGQSSSMTSPTRPAAIRWLTSRVLPERVGPATASTPAPPAAATAWIERPPRSSSSSRVVRWRSTNRTWTAVRWPSGAGVTPRSVGVSACQDDLVPPDRVRGHRAPVRRLVPGHREVADAGLGHAVLGEHRAEVEDRLGQVHPAPDVGVAGQRPLGADDHVRAATRHEPRESGSAGCCLTADAASDARWASKCSRRTRACSCS